MKGRAAGYAVCVQVISDKDRTDSGFYIHSEENKSARDYEVCEGIVVSLGKIAFKEFGEEDWCQVGDRVLFRKYSGQNLPKGKIADDDELYRLIRDEDIQWIF